MGFFSLGGLIAGFWPEKELGGSIAGFPTDVRLMHPGLLVLYVRNLETETPSLDRIHANKIFFTDLKLYHITF